MSCMQVSGTLLIITLLVAIAFGEDEYPTVSDLAKSCMPVCMKEKGATTAICEKSCEEASQLVSRNPSFLLWSLSYHRE